MVYTYLFTTEEPSESDENAENDPFFQVDFGPDFKKPEGKKLSKKQKAEKELEDKKERAELELLMLDSDSKSKHFTKADVIKSEKKQKNRNKKGVKQPLVEAQEDFKIDLQDPRFSSIVDSHTFSIDPTNPQFKKTKAMQEILSKRRNAANIVTNDDAEVPKQNSGSTLSALVESVKRKHNTDNSSKAKRKRIKN